MNYDKNSFLAGLAVGRKLGWNSGEPTPPSTEEGITPAMKIVYGRSMVYKYTGKVLTAPALVVGEYTEEA